MVLDRRGRVLTSGVRDIALAKPQPDWAEQDGDEDAGAFRPEHARHSKRAAGRTQAPPYNRLQREISR